MSPSDVIAVLTRWGRYELVCEVAQNHRVPVDELVGRSRSASIVRARHAAFAALRDSGLSYPEVAALFGMDHTSILHGVRKARERASIQGAA